MSARSKSFALRFYEGRTQMVGGVRRSEFRQAQGEAGWKKCVEEYAELSEQLITAQRWDYSHFPAVILLDVNEDDIASESGRYTAMGSRTQIASENQHRRPGPGTMMASTQPVRQSISRSVIQPRERQVQILMTSFCRSAHRRTAEAFHSHSRAQN